MIGGLLGLIDVSYGGNQGPERTMGLVQGRSVEDLDAHDVVVYDVEDEIARPRRFEADIAVAGP
jgi:hypothetical protein